jgi:hypothetical protein
MFEEHREVPQTRSENSQRNRNGGPNGKRSLGRVSATSVLGDGGNRRKGSVSPLSMLEVPGATGSDSAESWRSRASSSGEAVVSGTGSIAEDTARAASRWTVTFAGEVADWWDARQPVLDIATSDRARRGPVAEPRTSR